MIEFEEWQLLEYGVWYRPASTIPEFIAALQQLPPNVTVELGGDSMGLASVLSGLWYSPDRNLVSVM